MEKRIISKRENLVGVKELAWRTGASNSHLSRVLRGERAPGKALAAKLKRLGVTVDGGNKA